MAARKNLKHNDNTKGEIKATQLLNRLYSCANGEIELTAQQVHSAKIFIGKYKADLKAVELSGLLEHSLTVEITRFADKPSK